MAENIHVVFGPVDHKNPGFGYKLVIIDSDTGASLLSTAKHPVTGADLLTAADCLDIVQQYTKPTPRSIYLDHGKSYRTVRDVTFTRPLFTGGTWVEMTFVVPRGHEVVYEYSKKAPNTGGIEVPFFSYDPDGRGIQEYGFAPSTYGAVSSEDLEEVQTDCCRNCDVTFTDDEQQACPACGEAQ